MTWTLDECFNGNEEKDRKPIKELIMQFERYPGLKEIAFGVENLVVRRGQHASGVMMYNETPFETTALMRSPNGDITTQFDLHKSESLGDVKFDFLVTDICDKITTTLLLLQENEYFDKNLSLKEIYQEHLHPKKLNLKDPKIWQSLAEGSVQDVFQFNTQIGIETAKAIQPTNPAELTAANALMRLAAPEGQERPFDRYIRFKDDIGLWYEEMNEFGLSEEEQKILEPYYKRDYGVPASQEQLMLMVMDPNISHFTLAESNQTRKILAKKKVKEIPALKEKFIAQCPSQMLGEYCWRTMMLPQLSYSFSEVHSLLYSFIGIQTLVLATQFPMIYWNTACLIVNSGGLEDPMEVDDEDDVEEEEDSTKKKKTRSMNYGKVASAIGKMQTAGIEVSPPNINKSAYTFTPDEDHNIIRFGLSGITRISADLVQSIIANRPYTSLEDFLQRVKVNKTQMINLIKSGAFDEFGERTEVMRHYVNLISDTKKRITLQNLKMLFDFNLIPEKYDFQKRVFFFNKYLKKMKLDATYYGLDNIAFDFYANFDVDTLETTDETESGFKIKQSVWDAIYKENQNIIRPYVVEHNQELLEAVNNRLIKETWDKYCQGNISSWEMDSISFYSHEHELTGVDIVNGFSDFFELDEEPEIDKYIPIKGKQVPLFKLHRICGTVLDRDKLKKTVTILTTSGVVNVKIFGDAFSKYDKQISEIGADGKKHVIEKSWFKRGNKLIITGIRRGETFLAKKYSRTPYHLVELITDINENGMIETQGGRIDEE